MKLRTALVGLGPHGIRMIQASMKIDAIEWVALVDRNENTFQNDVVAATGALQLTELNQLWELGIQLLMVATNGPSHAPIALEGIKNGITHLLISKPYTCTLEDAIHLNAEAKRHNVRLVVDHLMRYDFTYNWLKQQAASGIWGKLKSMYIQRPGIGLGCLGVHSFDLANFINGQTPQTVTGWVDEPVKKNPRGDQFVDPGGLVILHYANGVRAIVEQLEEGSGPQSVELMFNHARVRMDEKYGILEVIEKDKNFVPGPNKKAPLVKTLNPHIPEFKIDTVLLLENLMKELVSDEPISADGAAGQSAVEILVAAYVSNSNQHAVVELPITKEEDLKLFLPVT